MTSHLFAQEASPPPFAQWIQHARAGSGGAFNGPGLQNERAVLLMAVLGFAISSVIHLAFGREYFEQTSRKWECVTWKPRSVQPVRTFIS